MNAELPDDTLYLAEIKYGGDAGIVAINETANATVNDCILRASGVPFGFTSTILRFSAGGPDAYARDMGHRKRFDGYSSLFDFQTSVASYNRKASTDVNIFNLNKRDNYISRREWVRTRADRRDQDREQRYQAFVWLNHLKDASQFKVMQTNSAGLTQMRVQKGSLRLGTLLRIGEAVYLTRRTDAVTAHDAGNPMSGGLMSNESMLANKISYLAEAFNERHFKRWLIDAEQFKRVQAGEIKTFRVAICFNRNEYGEAIFTPVSEVFAPTAFL